VKENYSEAVVAEKYTALYADLLNKQNNNELK
jgi:hypothetical protein